MDDWIMGASDEVDAWAIELMIEQKFEHNRKKGGQTHGLGKEVKSGIIWL